MNKDILYLISSYFNYLMFCRITGSRVVQGKFIQFRNLMTRTKLTSFTVRDIVHTFTIYIT